MYVLSVVMGSLIRQLKNVWRSVNKGIWEIINPIFVSNVKHKYIIAKNVNFANDAVFKCNALNV